MKEETPLIDTGWESFGSHPQLGASLAQLCLESLKRDPGREVIVDLGQGRRSLKSWMLLSLALILAERWRKEIPERRVGVVLPSGAGAMLTNIALVLAGKIPVNLNFTAGPEAIRSAYRQGEIRRVISAPAMREKVPNFPWPDDTVDLVSLLKGIPKWRILWQAFQARLTPVDKLREGLGLSAEGGDEEAALLFTSGSSGDPKGVVLAHRNIIGNCLQIADTALLEGDHTLMGCLPIFHSFGFTVTLWFPVLFPVRVVTLPSPLEVQRIAKAIESEKVTVMVGTPTFLRPYLKKATPEQLAPLRYVVAGAEKVPADLIRQFESKFGCSVLEGYGLTETSPVVAVNLPAESPFEERLGSGKCRKEGTVGRLFPGMQARVVDPDSGKELGFGETGMLYLRGPNVFQGYLNLPEKTREMIHGDWLCTGDLAKVDEDGFITIEGRLSRFSKIGGEMVPHGTVEEVLTERLGYSDAEERVLAVMGVQDENKGEALVLLSTEEIEPELVRKALQEAGLPNLWVPRKHVVVEKIPVLPAGKLDLKACDALAREGVNGSG